MTPADLDPATLRWVADELERQQEAWEAMPDAGVYAMASRDAAIGFAAGNVKRLRNRATRIERKRRKA